LPELLARRQFCHKVPANPAAPAHKRFAKRSDIPSRARRTHPLDVDLSRVIATGGHGASFPPVDTTSGASRYTLQSDKRKFSMSHQLTRRNVSAIAKLDLAGMSHAQRLEAIAKAIGFETAGALMSTLKSAEATPAPQAAQKPIRAIVAFGSTACSNVDSGEKLRDKYGNVEGDISEMTFNTPEELAAYAQGLSDADGWMDTQIVADEVDEPDHPFFAAQAANPDLDFVDWHDAQADGDEMLSPEEIAEAERRSLEEWIDIQIARSERNTQDRDELMSKERAGRADEPIIGYQVISGFDGKTWKDRPLTEVLTKEEALADLRDSYYNNEGSYLLVIVRQNDI